MIMNFRLLDFCISVLMGLLNRVRSQLWSAHKFEHNPPTPSDHYLRQEGYVFISVCSFLSSLLRLRKNYLTDFHKKNRCNGGTCAAE